MYARESWYDRAHKQIKRNAFIAMLGDFIIIFIASPLVFMLAYGLFIRAFWPALPALGFWPFFFALWALRGLVNMFKGGKK